jgi:hypothetical protein
MLIPDWLIRRVLAFVLGFGLMSMVMAAQEVMAGRGWILFVSPE